MNREKHGLRGFRKRENGKAGKRARDEDHEVLPDGVFPDGSFRTGTGAMLDG
jgi:hypothetical protein